MLPLKYEGQKAMKYPATAKARHMTVIFTDRRVGDSMLIVMRTLIGRTYKILRRMRRIIKFHSSQFNWGNGLIIATISANQSGRETGAFAECHALKSPPVCLRAIQRSSEELHHVAIVVT